MDLIVIMPLRPIALLIAIFAIALTAFNIYRIPTNCSKEIAACRNGSSAPENIISACSKLIEHPDISTDNLHFFLTKRARAFKKMEDYENALSDVDQALELQPENVDTWILRACVNNTCSVDDFAAEHFEDTLVIDLDRDGVELTDVNNSTVFFDLDVNGFAEQTGWVGADDGLLAFDRNGNGWIDNNTELFGDGTGHADGFAHLSEFDTNGDGIIDAADDDFSQLLIWRDSGSDGKMGVGETTDLSANGIAGISLSARAVDEVNQSNRVVLRSDVQFTDGSTGIIEDIQFSTNTRKSAKLLDPGFRMSPEAYVQPVLFGHGRIASTWVTLTENTDLLARSEGLTELLKQGDVSTFITQFEDYMLAWAGVSDVGPASRGDFVDGRYLAFVEALRIDKFHQLDRSAGRYLTDPNTEAGIIIEKYYERMLERFSLRFMAQAPQASVLMGELLPEYDAITGVLPLGFLHSLTLNYTPKHPALSGDLKLVVKGMFEAISAGRITAENAASILDLLRHDLGHSDQRYYNELGSYLSSNSDRSTASAIGRLIADGSLAIDTLGDDPIEGGSQ